MSVLLNARDGFLADAVEYNTGIGVARDVAIGDLDGDGDADLVVAYQNFGGGITVLLNRGNGTFIDDLPPFLSNGASESVVVGDLDGDGDMDVAVSNAGGGDLNDNSVVVFLNEGDSTFATPSAFPVGRTPRSLAIGDLDGDGNLDLVTGSRRDGTLSVLLNNGNGGFAPHIVYTLGEAFSGQLAEVVLADIDGDEDLDVIIGVRNFSFNRDDEVILLLNSGDGEFSVGPTLPVQPELTVIAVGDIDFDGDVDIVTAFSRQGGGVTILINDGSGASFTRAGSALATRWPQARRA